MVLPVSDENLFRYLAMEDPIKRYSIRRELQDQELRRQTAANTLPNFSNPRNGRMSADFEVSFRAIFQTFTQHASTLKGGFTRAYIHHPQSPLSFTDNNSVTSDMDNTNSFRRGSRLRSSLPIIRTNSQTLERPLGKFRVRDCCSC